VLTGGVRERLDALLREKCAEHDWPVIALEVEPDHVHLFVKAHPKHSPSYVANQLKGFTSHVLRAEFPHLRSRLPTLWSRSYFVATVGAVSAGTVTRYIETQNERPWRKAAAREADVQVPAAPDGASGRVVDRDAERPPRALQRGVAGASGRLRAPVEDQGRVRGPSRPS
jgi:putative transposase